LGFVMLLGEVFYIFNTRQESLCVPYAYRVMLLGEDKGEVKVNQKLFRISGKVLPEIRKIKSICLSHHCNGGKTISKLNAELWNLALFMYSGISASHHIRKLFSRQK